MSLYYCEYGNRLVVRDLYANFLNIATYKALNNVKSIHFYSIKYSSLKSMYTMAILAANA